MKNLIHNPSKITEKNNTFIWFNLILLSKTVTGNKEEFKKELNLTDLKEPKRLKKKGL